MNRVKRLGAAIIVMLCMPATAGAHRLDEYLQATRIDVGTGTIAIEMSLTPGSGVADAVLAILDPDADGQISDGEADAYTKRLAGDLRLQVDDRAFPLTVSRREFPDAEDIRAGTGVVRLAATTVAAPSGGGRHRLVFTNAHMPDVSAYLVNILAPANGDIRVGTQQRDHGQRVLVVDYEIVGPGQAVWSLLAGATIAALLISRRRRAAAGGTPKNRPNPARNSWTCNWLAFVEKLPRF